VASTPLTEKQASLLFNEISCNAFYDKELKKPILGISVATENQRGEPFSVNVKKLLKEMNEKMNDVETIGYDKYGTVYHFHTHPYLGNPVPSEQDLITGLNMQSRYNEKLYSCIGAANPEGKVITSYFFTPRVRAILESHNQEKIQSLVKEIKEKYKKYQERPKQFREGGIQYLFGVEDKQGKISTMADRGDAWSQAQSRKQFKKDFQGILVMSEKHRKEKRAHEKWIRKKEKEKTKSKERIKQHAK
jgi:hypothetical protein